ncbi:MAG TPA: OBAP family protein [Micromonosporaceae bacterium]
MNPTIKKRPSPLLAAGGRKAVRTAVLEQGAAMLQDRAPLKDFDVYVVGFHCAKNEPDMQMEAHHYCKMVNQDLIQCVLFDGNTRDANLIGVEYIVSERLFDSLPEQERGYWHPHNFEILSGQLVAPGLPDVAEKAFFKLLMNSYGKTWHTWHTGRHDNGEVGPNLPVGDPKLMWSFNREHECDPALERNRNEVMGFDIQKKRRDRQTMLGLAHPQHGVDAMRDQFIGTSPVPGVVDAEAAGPVPASVR